MLVLCCVVLCSLVLCYVVKDVHLGSADLCDRLCQSKWRLVNQKEDHTKVHLY